MQKKVDIAIVGMSCIFPGAGDLDTFWNNIENKVDAIQPVPGDRLDAVFFDPDSREVDRFYCWRGGFIDEFAEFDPGLFGILPVSVEGTEPEHLLALSLAHRALTDAGVFEKNILTETTGIVIGKGNYAGPGAVRAIEIIRTGEQIARLLKDILPKGAAEEIDKIKKEFQSGKGRFAADTAMGLIPNLVASLVANRLNLGGPAYTVDAACASSLIAIDHAVKELSARSCDLFIAGGVHACQNAPFWSIFTQLGALSKSQRIRPFDRQADGLLIGEGCGFVVLKRLEDAIRDDHRIYAVIKGVGVSSDGAGTSLMSPSVKGQSKAIRQAWDNARLDPDEIGYIEAHGTGTPLGDRTEMESLSGIFHSRPHLARAGIGSVKSNIGHAMPAAGIAGLIKTALALYHNKLPPTLHCEDPLELMKQSRFTPVTEAVDWDAADLPKRAGVNAFGFGGINAHVVLESFGHSGTLKGHTRHPKEEILLLARTDREALIRALEDKEKAPGKGDYRIALFDPTPERIQKALRIVRRGLPWRNKQDIWFSNESLIPEGGKIAFLFPGLDGLTGGEITSIARYFNLPFSEPGAVRSDAELISPVSGEVLSSALQLAERSRIIDIALRQLDIQPDLYAGHSVGEWLAGRSAGWVAEEAVVSLLQRLDPRTFELKEVAFLAVGCSYDRLEPILRVIGDIYLSNDNCPQQVIVCGTNTAIRQLTALLQDQQVFHQLLPFRSGFHSPFLKDKLDILLNGLKGIQFQKTRIPLWSATTLEVYPEEQEEVRQLSIAHLLQPVRFRELTEKLYEEGVRIFIQVGSGGLTGFIDDTLKGKSYSTVAANVAARPGLAQLKRVLAALFTEGKEVNLSFLGIDEEKKIPSSPAMKLQLGSPFIGNIPSLQCLVARTSPSDQWPRRTVGAPLSSGALSGFRPSPSPLMQAFVDNCNGITQMQSEIITLFNNRDNHAPSTARVLRAPILRQLDISLDNHPYLIDHSLVRQRPGWHCVKDMNPVIPMTMMLELFGEIAGEGAPGVTIQKMTNINIWQWMSVATPFREKVFGEWQAPDRLEIKIEKYAGAEIVFSEKKVAGQTPFDIGAPLHISITPEKVYEQHMFHGPAYQGIRQVTQLAEKGIAGLIEGGTGKGSLLDNAGQLFGLWLQLSLQKDKIAFPVKIKEIEFYGDRKQQQGLFECCCQLTDLTDEFATADFIVKKEDRVWAVVRGWQNRRLEIDEQFWKVAMSPLRNFLSREIAPGIFMFHNAYNRLVSWDLVYLRYFSLPEREFQSSLPPKRKKEWTISRIAAKDAVRSLLVERGRVPLYPVEFCIRSDEKGRPFPDGEGMEKVHVSLAHKGTDAVAVARYGMPVGIDMELIEPRGKDFDSLAFHPEELALIGTKEHCEWITRCWVAKEAFGKYLGLGLQGNPRAYRIGAIDGEVIRIENISIKTIKHKNYIIGWTQ